MKNYLDLIPLFSKVHRRETHMIRLCIIISVFLVASIFGMADLFLQSQKKQAIMEDGAWHVAFKELTKEQTSLIRARPEVKNSSRYDALNYRLDKNYKIKGTKTVVCGFDETFFNLYPGTKITEGNFPQKEEEALISESVRNKMKLSVGDKVELETPKKVLTFKISGFVEDTSMMLKYGAFGIFLDTETYLAHFQDKTQKEDFMFYVEFVSGCSIQNVVRDICEKLKIPSDHVSENAKLMGTLFQSRNSYILKLYFIAVILAVLVMFSGILMIMGSMNSNVSQRTEFFGMMRCLGATKKQIRQFVVREALLWCREAIPIAMALSIAATWILCHILKNISPTYFGEMPGFGISFIGLFAGSVIGLFSVFTASLSPARKASAVSPIAAVSGNANTVFEAKGAANTRLFYVETALGIHHATGSKKNLFLVTASFAFSIVLFLGFSTGIDFMNHAITPMRPYTPDISVISPDNGLSISREMFAGFKENPAVKRIYGRSFAYDLPAKYLGQNKKVTLISYEKFQFAWAMDDLIQGDMEKVKNGEGVLLVEKDGFPGKPGETLEIKTDSSVKQVTIEGVLKFAQFDSEKTGILICSEELFYRLTGERGYTIVDIQLKDLSDTAVKEIQNMVEEKYTFSDQRMSNKEVRAVYYSFSLFIYGFLFIVALIAVFNIMNSIGMSVSARQYQYGAMRAVGTSIGQLKIMITAETLTYLICGFISGLALGVPLHYFLYRQMITSRWGDLWKMPVGKVGIIFAVMLFSAIAAIKGPVRRLSKMSIVKTVTIQ